MIPAWFHDLSIAYVSLGSLCAAILAIEIAHSPQQMWDHGCRLARNGAVRHSLGAVAIFQLWPAPTTSAALSSSRLLI